MAEAFFDSAWNRNDYYCPDLKNAMESSISCALNRTPQARMAVPARPFAMVSWKKSLSLAAWRALTSVGPRAPPSAVAPWQAKQF